MEEKPLTDGLTHQLVDSYEADRSLFKFLRKCGQGQFADVYEGLYNNTIKVAIKTLKCAASEQNRCDFLTEASIMAQFDNTNVMSSANVTTMERCRPAC